MFNYLTSILFIFIINHQYIHQFKNSYNSSLIYYNQTLINSNNNDYQLVNIFLHLKIFLSFTHLLISIYLYRKLNYHILNQNHTLSNVIQIIQQQLFSIGKFYKVILWFQTINLIILTYWLYNHLNLYWNHYINLGYILFFNYLKYSIPYLCLLLANYWNYDIFQHLPNNIDHIDDPNNSNQ